MDPARDDEDTLHGEAVDAFKQALYFTAQGHWLLSRFPQASFQAVPGLCKAVTRGEIVANDFSLTPGRYVGVAASGAGRGGCRGLCRAHAGHSCGAGGAEWAGGGVG